MGHKLRGLALSLALAGISSAWAAQGPVFNYEGKSYQGDSLPVALRQQLYEQEVQFNQQRRQAFDQYVLNRYLLEEAKRQNKAPGDLQKEWLQVERPSEAELKAFYDANRANIPAPFEQVKNEIAQYLGNQQVQAKQQELIERVRQEKGYRLTLSEPQAPRFEVLTEGYPAKGNPEAKVTLIEFADYQCPHCKQASSAVQRLLESYGDQLRVVYRDFPINPSGISRRVAEAAVCADEQGRFWEFNALAFERQQYLSSIEPDMLADELELDMQAFDSCFAKEEPKQKVAASLEEGNQLGITGTPTFFVNGRQLHPHGPLEAALKEAIDAALKES